MTVNTRKITYTVRQINAAGRIGQPWTIANRDTLSDPLVVPQYATTAELLEALRAQRFIKNPEDYRAVNIDGEIRLYHTRDNDRPAFDLSRAA